jgi:hydrogenase/urease accessory protein HupE
LVNSGLGPLYDGVLHLLLSPGDLLGLVAAGLLAGLNGAPAGRWTVIMLPAAWLLGGVLGMNLQAEPELPWISVVSFMILGILVAADVRLPPAGIATVAGLYGVWHGVLNGSALAALGVGSTALWGIVSTVAVVALLTAAAVVAVRTFWVRVAVRVAGSWIVAVGMLMLGWLAQGTA